MHCVGWAKSKCGIYIYEVVYCRSLKVYSIYLWYGSDGVTLWFSNGTVSSVQAYQDSSRGASCKNMCFTSHYVVLLETNMISLDLKSPQTICFAKGFVCLHDYAGLVHSIWLIYIYIYGGFPPPCIYIYIYYVIWCWWMLCPFCIGVWSYLYGRKWPYTALRGLTRPLSLGLPRKPQGFLGSLRAS